MNKTQKRAFKIVLIGDCNVGKTCLVESLINGKFTEQYKPTIGAGHTLWQTEIEGENCDFEIWDTAGEERFASLAPIYYKESNGAIVVFAQNDVQSSKNVAVWIDRFQSTCSSNIPILICCNKIDLEPTFDNIMEQYAANRGYMYQRASAYTGENVESVFETLADRIKATKVNLPTTRMLEEKEKKNCC